MNIPRNRSNSNKKLKEKYEVLFKNEETELPFNEVICSVNSINLDTFEQKIAEVNFEQAVNIRNNFKFLFKACLKDLELNNGK